MTNEPLDPDQAARELGRANRKPLVIGLGVAAAIAVAVVVYIKMGESKVRGLLADKGFTEIKLESTGTMSWKFEAKKGDAECSGTVERSFGSMSSTEACITHTKKRSTREQIESHFADDYGKYGFDTFACPEIDKQDEITCTLSSNNGVKSTVVVTATKRDEDGSWSAWHTKHPFFTTAEEMKEKMTKEISDALVAKFPKATFEFDCGTKTIAFDADNKYSCKLKVQNPDKTPTLNLTYTDDGMSWKVDGL